MVLVKNIFLLIVLAVDIVLPIVGTLRWWRWSAGRWQMHVLLVPALLAFNYLLMIALFYALMGLQGRPEGIQFLQMPALATSVLCALIYYGAVVAKRLRRLV